MAEQIPVQPPRDRAHEFSLAIFQQAWRVYRVLIDENYVFHREAYACLSQILREEMRRPFHFLDVACGDATPSVAALAGTAIVHYSGIDLSAAALDLARQTLAALDCPVTLEQADFVERLSTWTEPVDVVWIGLGLHHLQTPEKLAVMRTTRSILREDGLFLCYDNASPDGETRDEWLQRWDDQQPAWTAYTVADWNAMTGHVHEANFPETSSGWFRLGREAGFTAIQERFVSPSNQFRLYAMRP